MCKFLKSCENNVNKSIINCITTQLHMVHPFCIILTFSKSKHTFFIPCDSTIVCDLSYLTTSWVLYDWYTRCTGRPSSIIIFFHLFCPFICWQSSLPDMSFDIWKTFNCCQAKQSSNIHYHLRNKPPITTTVRICAF